MAIGYALSDDLMFVSRMTGTARDLGLAMKTARTPAALLALADKEAPACVLIDLNLAGLDIVPFAAALKIRGSYLVGYGSHVDAATLSAARAAGVDHVVPRSRFVEELPRNLAAWYGSAKQCDEKPASQG
jgi:ActR/RegA family two-component response regulator